MGARNGAFVFVVLVQENLRVSQLADALRVLQLGHPHSAFQEGRPLDIRHVTIRVKITNAVFRAVCATFTAVAD